MRPKCDWCDKPADYNFQEVWITYIIEDDEDAHGGYKYVEDDAVNSGDNLFYCEEHAEEAGYI